MYRVTVRILATPEDFWASVDFVDSSGKTHRREVRQDRAAPMRSNMLQALISAVGILTKPCGLTVIAQNDYLEAPMTQGWICAWRVVSETQGFKSGFVHNPMHSRKLTIESE